MYSTRSEVQSLHVGVYSTSIDIGFFSWYSILVFALGFCSRLGRTFRVTAKVRGIVRGPDKSFKFVVWQKKGRVLGSRQKVI